MVGVAQRHNSRQQGKRDRPATNEGTGNAAGGKADLTIDHVATCPSDNPVHHHRSAAVLVGNPKPKPPIIEGSKAHQPKASLSTASWSSPASGVMPTRVSPMARVLPGAPSDEPAAPAAQEAAPTALEEPAPDADEAVIRETAIEHNAFDLLSRLVAESETASKVEVTKDEIASLMACFKQMREAGGGTGANSRSW